MTPFTRRAISLALVSCLSASISLTDPLRAATRATPQHLPQAAPTDTLTPPDRWPFEVSPTPPPGSSQNVNVVGSWLAGSTYCVTVANNIAYFGDGPMLDVMDFSVPAAPVMRDRLKLVLEITDIVIVGNFAYVTAGKNLWIIDVTNPDHVFLVSTMVTSGDANDVSVCDGRAYVAALGAGIDVIDVSTPSQPAKIGFFAQNDVRGVVAQGTRAYSVGGYEGVHCLDISDPAHPWELANQPTFDGQDVVLVGGLLYVAGSPMRIVNVTNAANPFQVGSVSAGSGFDVAVSGHYAYLAAFTAAMVIDVADPAHPKVVGSFDPSREVYGVAVSGNLLFVANYMNGLYVRDITTPSNPSRLYHYDAIDDLRAVKAQGNYLYVADRYYGLKIVDVSDVTNPLVVGKWGTDFVEYVEDVAVTGDFAYVADWDRGLRIINVADPTQPVEVGSYESGGTVWPVAAEGNLVFIGDNNGLDIIDVSSPAAPFQVGSWNGFNYANYGFPVDIAATSGRVFIAAYFEGLRVLDVTNPAAPVELSPTPSPESYVAEGVATQAGNGYVATSSGIKTAIFYSPSDWYLTNASAVPGLDLSFGDGLAYIANGTSGFRIADFAGRAGAEVGYYITQSVATDISAARGYGFGLSEFEGLFILEYLRPVPVMLQAFDLEAVKDGIRATWSVFDEAGTTAYRLLRAPSGGKVHVNVTTPPVAARGLSKYEFMDNNVTPGSRYSYTLVAVNSDGSERVLGSREVSAKTAVLVLEQNVPNPFNPDTELRVQLPEAADIDLSIYDATGTFVTRLDHGPAKAGTRTYRWQGVDAHGQPVASGVYLCRLQSGKQVLTRKLVLVR